MEGKGNAGRTEEEGRGGGLEAPVEVRDLRTTELELPVAEEVNRSTGGRATEWGDAEAEGWLQGGAGEGKERVRAVIGAGHGEKS